MSKNCRRNAFTLIEVLIVVIIMAVLAATIIPQFSSSTADATQTTMQFNLHTMRSQIELYKMQHLGLLPGAPAGDFTAQMTSETNTYGVVNMGASDPATYPLGPYMQEVPLNPLNNLSTVIERAVADGAGIYGWQYDPTSGLIYPEDTSFFAPAP